MRPVGSSVLLQLGLAFGLSLGVPVALSGVDAPAAAAALTLFVDDVAAFQLLDVGGASDSGAGGDADATGGDGGRGGFATVHDIGNAHADASSSVIIDDITTGDASGHDVTVDARGATDPVVVAVAGSFPDTGVDVFAPGGSAQAGTTGGNGIAADASGGDGGNARSSGGDSGDNNSCSAALGCLDLSLILDLLS